MDEVAQQEAEKTRFRKLRVAWSATWTLAAVLLVAIWVRSYYYVDSIDSLFGRPVAVSSSAGFVCVYASKAPPPSVDWRFMTAPQMKGHTKFHPDMNEPEWAVPFGFRWKVVPSFGVGVVIMPIWFLVGGAACFGALPWIPRIKRFSLRMLLIATTVVAVGLGVVIALNG